MNSKNRWQQWLRGSLIVASVALLASCGGGKREAFHPAHIYVFGDEYSYVDLEPTPSSTDQMRFTVNVVAKPSTTVYNALAYPSWTQYLASYYGRSQQTCSSTASNAMNMCATGGSNVAGPDVAKVISDINTHAYQKDDLLVIMAGTRDILNAYRSFKGDPVNIATYANNAKQAGIALAQKINSLVSSGARVAVATIPDIGLSPYAVSEAGGAGSPPLRDYQQAMECTSAYQPSPGEYSKALSYLTACFNNGLRGINGIINDGRKIALIDTFDWSVLVARNPSGYGLVDVFNAACPSVANSSAATYDPTACYVDTVTTPTPTTPAQAPTNAGQYMWSFGPWLGPGGHSLLGARAVSQVNLNWGS